MIMAKITIKVIPKSTRQEVKKVGDVTKVWLHAPPAEGQANEELVLVLAKHFSVPKSAIKITSGLSSRNKVVDILGISEV
jgi:uncharacterized protein (TIGR00251 family)